MDFNKNSFEKLMDLINMIGHAILLNLLFLVSCIPVVTIGPALSGLYSSVRFNVRKESPYAGFREGFKTCFLRNAIATVLCIAVGYFGLNNLYGSIMAMIADPSLIGVGTILVTSVHLMILLAALLFGTAMIPVNLYFENDINGWIKDTWTLVRYAPWQTLAVGAILWLPIVVIIWFPQWGILALMVFVAVYYAVMGVIATALLKNGLVRILKNKREEEQ